MADKVPDADIQSEIASGLDWIVTALNSSGYAADFSPDSISEVERFFREHVWIERQADGSSTGRPNPWGPLALNHGTTLIAIGYYVGEVMRKQVGGEWMLWRENADATAIPALLLPDGSMVWPEAKVVKRFHDERENLDRYCRSIVAQGKRDA